MRKAITKKTYQRSGAWLNTRNNGSAVIVRVQHQLAARIIRPMVIEIDNQRHQPRIIVAKAISVGSVKRTGCVAGEMQLHLMRSEKQCFVEMRLQLSYRCNRVALTRVHRRMREPASVVPTQLRVGLHAHVATHAR